MSFPRNSITGERHPLPRLMWADCDPSDKRTPVAVYNTKSDQRGNRPELKPSAVVVIPLDTTARMLTDLHQAIAAAKERGLKF